MCELCGGNGDIAHAHIVKDDGQTFTGELCKECRTGRTLCGICNFLIPAHGSDCPAGPTPGYEGT